MKANKDIMVARVDSWNKLIKQVNYDSKVIKVVIARLSECGKYPSNYSRHFEDRKDCPGGCMAQIFASSSSYAETIAAANLYSQYGRDIAYGDTNEYETALAAVKKIDKKSSEIYTSRGGAADAAEAMGRWLECCGVDQVWMRPKDAPSHNWLSHGDWNVVARGAFVGMVRGMLYDPAKKEEGVAA